MGFNPIPSIKYNRVYYYSMEAKHATTEAQSEYNNVRDEIRAEHDCVVDIEVYRNFGKKTANVTVEDGTHGTGLVIQCMKEWGFEIQNVNMEHCRLKFNKYNN